MASIESAGLEAAKVVILAASKETGQKAYRKSEA